MSEGQDLADDDVFSPLEAIEWQWGDAGQQLAAPSRGNDSYLTAVNTDDLASLLDEAEGVARRLRAITWTRSAAFESLRAAEVPPRLESLLAQDDVRLLVGCRATYEATLDVLMHGYAFQRAASERSVRLVVPASTPQPVLRGLSGLGAQVRTSSQETPVLVALAGDQGLALTEAGSVWIDVPSPMLHAMTRLWDLLWGRPQHRPPSPDLGVGGFRPLRDDRDGTVLRHLALGVKDVVAAREMNVSLRTYRRYVAELMDHLGASSRFQAGAIAVRIGLLTPERAHLAKGALR
jgi:hypothetical protein